MSLGALDKAKHYALRRQLCIATTAHTTLAHIAQAQSLNAADSLRASQAHRRAREALQAALAMLDADSRSKDGL